MKVKSNIGYYEKMQLKLSAEIKQHEEIIKQKTAERDLVINTIVSLTALEGGKEPVPEMDLTKK